MPPSKPKKGPAAPAREQKRRNTAAKRIVKIVLAAGERSELKKEYDSQRQEECVVAFTALLAGDDFLKGNEPNTLNKAGRSWVRWSRWLQDKDPLADPYRSPPAVWTHFLRSVAKRGPTAASGVYGSLAFLERHGKFGLPLRAGVVSGYTHDAPTTNPHRRHR